MPETLFRGAYRNSSFWLLKDQYEILSAAAERKGLSRRQFMDMAVRELLTLQEREEWFRVADTFARNKKKSGRPPGPRKQTTIDTEPSINAITQAIAAASGGFTC